MGKIQIFVAKKLKKSYKIRFKYFTKERKERKLKAKN